MVAFGLNDVPPHAFDDTCWIVIPLELRARFSLIAPLTVRRIMEAIFFSNCIWLQVAES